MRAIVVIGSLPVWLALGCGSDPAGASSASRAPAEALRVASVASAAGEPASLRDRAPETIDDDTFVESDHNRDPFRRLARPVADPPEDGRPVALRGAAIGSVRLEGIVGGSVAPVAMVTDGSRAAEPVRRGDAIGTAEPVTMSGPDRLAVHVHWRVERIHSDRVVLLREDPEHPGEGTRRVLTFAL